MASVKVFVARTGNAFMADIAAWITEAASLAGHQAELLHDQLPQRDGSINLVVAPHEFFVLHQADDAQLRAAAAASVPVCTEQPGTPWYRLALEYVRLSKMALDINRHGVVALVADGVDTHHLPLGAVPSMNRQGLTRHSVGRDIDVLFLGGDTPRRGAKLASLAPLLYDRTAELRMFRFSSPVHDGVPGLVFGAEKYDLLARSRILVNIHRDDTVPGYFEWARMVESMANGCTVLTEPSSGFEPLQPGVHFVESHDLAADLAALLGDPDRCDRIAAAASHAVLVEHSLTDSLAPLLDRIAAIPDPPPEPTRHTRRAKALPRGHKPPLLPVWAPHDALRRRTYEALLAEQQLQRNIERARCRLRYGVADHVERVETPAYAAAEPHISVIVTLFNYAAVVVETLDSVIASTDANFEIVVVDDHSTDTGRAVVASFMAAHPDVPMLLLGSDVNRGLPASRNAAFAAARAARVMVMDADNLVYPTCLSRLSAALDADPQAAFAYAALEEFGVTAGVRSAMGWYVPWLCEANYIDAQAMIRTDVITRHGGYHDFGHGWEDWELWLRLAAAGEYGVHVRQMLGRYRTQPSSMVSITNLAQRDLQQHLRELHPSLPWPLP